MVLLQQMVIFLIYMMIGYFLTKGKIFDQHVSQALSWLIINVANVALILSSVVNGSGSIRGEALLLTAGIAGVSYAVLLVLAWLLPRLFRVKREEVPVYRLMTVFNNVGFIGNPVVAAIYGADALLYVAVFVMFFNVLIYTYGYLTIQGGSKLQWKKLVNPGVIACVLALVLYLGGMQAPEFLKTLVSGLGSLTGPLSMIVIGISLANLPLHQLVTNVKLDLFMLVKLLLIPTIGMLLIKQVTTDPVLLGVCLIMLGTPTASIVAMLAQQNHRGYELAACGVSLSTILSVGTIPLLTALLL